MHQVVGILWLAFKIWMIVDAVRRRAPLYWYLIIFFIPFGEFIYFFLIKYRSIQTPPPKTVTRAPGPARDEGISELERAHKLTPSLDNKVALARALFEEGKTHRAGNLFYEVLEMQRDNVDALHGLGMCFIKERRFEEAISPLEKLIDKSPSYRDWGAWPNLAWALREAGRGDEEEKLLRTLVKANPRMDHRIFLARYLSDHGQTDEARAILEEAIEDHDQSPDYLRKKNRSWAALAIKNLSEL